MNNEDLMQHYLLRKINEGLHYTFNSINEYQLYDNSMLNDISNFENYKLMQEIINFSNVINNDLIKLKTNKMSIDNIKRKRDE